MVNLEDKRRVREEQARARRILREEKRDQRECFWTRPYGHAWVDKGGTVANIYECAGCRKKKVIYR